jgi:hypothetical protein
MELGVAEVVTATSEGSVKVHVPMTTALVDNLDRGPERSGGLRGPERCGGLYFA